MDKPAWIGYDELRQMLESLEAAAQPSPLTPAAQAFVRSPTSAAGKPRSQHQFIAIDPPQSGSNGPQPIVVAVGMNYTQGDQVVPRDLGLFAVEDSLRSCRTNAAKLFAHFSQNRSRWHDAGCVSDHAVAVPAQSFHFVMTNVCPWITTERWQDLPALARRDLYERGSVPVHLRDLVSSIGHLDVAWIAHGRHAEVFEDWPRLAADLGITRWWRSGNLSYFYNYDRWPLLRRSGG